MKKILGFLFLFLPTLAISQDIEKFYRTYKNQADKCFKSGDFYCAKQNYESALFIKNGDEYCTQKLKETIFNISQPKPETKINKTEIIKLIIKGGGLLEGEFVIGELTGKGKCIWDSGNFYEGEFIKGKRTGNGKFTWSNGNIYEGKFVNNELFGLGKFQWTNGNFYVGDFVNGQITGKGRFIYIDGPIIYEGDFLNGLKEGYGRCEVKSGNIGDGILNCLLCVKFEGNWEKDVKAGFGRCYDKFGKLLYEGVFENDKPVSKYPMD